MEVGSDGTGAGSAGGHHIVYQHQQLQQQQGGAGPKQDADGRPQRRGAPREPREGGKGSNWNDGKREKNDRRRQRRDRDEKGESEHQSFTIAKPAVPAVPAITVVQRDTAQASTGPSGSKRKFLDDSFEICFDSVFKILAEQPEFTVVGVLGTQGTGKSSILSALSGHKNPEDAFVIQAAEKEIEGRHETVGVDISVSAERFLLLDTQPLFSMSVLTDMIKTEHAIPADVVSYENLHDLQSIQLAVFLLRVCHVVIVVEDNVPDWNTLKFLKLVEMLRYNIPDVASPSLTTPAEGKETDEESDKNDKNDYHPDVVFVVNKTRDDSLDNKQAVQRLMNHALVDSAFRKDGAVSWTDASGVSPTREGGENVNLFFLPCKPAAETVDNTHALESMTDATTEYGSAMMALRDQILNLRRRTFQRPITEREWARNCVKVWELTRKSEFITEFNRTMQQMQLYRT